MILNYARDGQEFNKNNLIDNGFNIDERDFQINQKGISEQGMETEGHEYVLNFVGFLTNHKGDIFSVFPKNYKVENLKKDSIKLFKVIAKHMQRRPEIYLGNYYGDKFKSNYPFAAFFGIYEYYSKYGLYFEENIHIKPNSGKKVNWKATIRLSDKYIFDNNLVFLPIYYEKKYYFKEFLTKCMIFAIDYTIDKFNMFIDLNKTGQAFPDFNFFNEKEVILNKLISLRQQTFKDNLIELIDHLINFFKKLNEGGDYYLKHYSFRFIWEDMVMNYLKTYYKEVKDNKIVFDKKNSSSSIDFTKKSFYPNLANKKDYFTPDHYYCEKKNQLIFDAKYYTSIQGMNYKQIAYHLFLNEYREDIDDEPKFSNTYSALILPAEKRKSKIHFKMDPKFNKSNSDIEISEEYIDIREVINAYL